MMTFSIEKTIDSELPIDGMATPLYKIWNDQSKWVGMGEGLK